jgi:hypothetical protein
MGRFPGWAKWPIIAAGVLLSPVFAFLLALSGGGSKLDRRGCADLCHSSDGRDRRGRPITVIRRSTVIAPIDNLWEGRVDTV